MSRRLFSFLGKKKVDTEHSSEVLSVKDDMVSVSLKKSIGSPKVVERVKHSPKVHSCFFNEDEFVFVSDLQAELYESGVFKAMPSVKRALLYAVMSYLHEKGKED